MYDSARSPNDEQLVLHWHGQLIHSDHHCLFQSMDRSDENELPPTMGSPTPSNRVGQMPPPPPDTPALTAVVGNAPLTTPANKMPVTVPLVIVTELFNTLATLQQDFEKLCAPKPHRQVSCTPLTPRFSASEPTVLSIPSSHLVITTRLTGQSHSIFTVWFPSPTSSC